ncbi:hypothetical protein QBC46DRAFT_449099 [Diplogelasinospora grovesii]|uniref:Uncharacterized protein n=1 Tax=Diplogelasinospora grovesii TaxID=303347 RepID=A0AAN6N926_9PEZI|nr:hypothetical protein QBC46DRAFT_449099 [Diplogelasinospora grovesii]
MALAGYTKPTITSLLLLLLLQAGCINGHGYIERATRDGISHVLEPRFWENDTTSTGPARTSLRSAATTNCEANAECVTTPYANLSTASGPSWTTVPIAQLTTDPFCHNEAAPHEGVGNHCVCKNGATLEIIPFTSGGNLSDYQPCAYTTVDTLVNSTVTSVVPAMVTQPPETMTDTATPTEYTLQPLMSYV